MEIEALGAAHGDAIVVRWNDDGGAPRIGLVDGGPANAFAAGLQPKLSSLAADAGGGPLRLDFVCVSHIDDDHIGGIERLFTTIRRDRRDGKAPQVSVRRLWFNSWDLLGMKESTSHDLASEPATGASVRQGRDLRDGARLLGVDGNDPVNGAFLAGTGFDLDGLRVDVVAPGQAQLAKLMTVWAKAEQALPAFAAAFKDRAVPNLSSIAVLLGAGGRTALLTGDARADHLLTGLADGGFLPGGHLHVDVLKLPHHGSINNVNAAFFDAVSADRYIVSADGVTHGLPNHECLELLVNSRPAGERYEILLTNPMPAVEALLASRIDAMGMTVVVRRGPVRGLVA